MDDMGYIQNIPPSSNAFTLSSPQKRISLDTRRTSGVLGGGELGRSMALRQQNSKKSCDIRGAIMVSDNGRQCSYKLKNPFSNPQIHSVVIRFELWPTYQTLKIYMETNNLEVTVQMIFSFFKLVIFRFQPFSFSDSGVLFFQHRIDCQMTCEPTIRVCWVG